MSAETRQLWQEWADACTEMLQLRDRQAGAAGRAEFKRVQARLVAASHALAPVAWAAGRALHAAEPHAWGELGFLDPWTVAHARRCFGCEALRPVSATLTRGKPGGYFVAVCRDCHAEATHSDPDVRAAWKLAAERAWMARNGGMLTYSAGGQA